MDYSRYQTLNITRRGVDGAVLDIQMRALNGKLPTKRVETRHPYLLLASTPEPKAQEPHDVDENA